LLAVIAVTLLALVAGLISRGPNPVLTAVTLPLVLFLPGYALIALILPYGHLGFPERIALGLGVSIAIAALGGLLLNALHVPLGATSWRLALAAFTLALALLALWRRTSGKLAPPGALSARMTPREVSLMGVGALLIGLALGLGAVGAARPAGGPFTAFWALSDQAVIRVGLENSEDTAITYRIAVQAGDRLVAEWPQVSLPAGGHWQAEATVPASLRGQTVDALAYRSDDLSGQPYRRARVVIAADAQP
jgi:hypothetical protein